MAEWWEAAPTVQQFAQNSGQPAPAAPQATGEWWEAAPTVQQYARRGAGLAGPVEQSSERGSGIGSAAVASLAQDPAAQIRWYAQQRGIPESRYGIKDGQIFYMGDDGKPYAEVPEAWDPKSIARRVATGAGPAIPAVTGAAAGIASAPLMATGVGLLGSMGIAGAGGAGGQAIREALANKIMGQEVSPARIATEGGVSALGQGIGAGMSAFGNRSVARDIGRMDPARAADIQAKAGQANIPLTPAEITGLPSLKAQQKYLGNTVGGQDTLDAFYRARQEKVTGAITRYLDSVSKTDSAEIAGKMGRDAAETAIDAMKTARAAKAGPFYDDAFSKNIAMDSPRLRKLEQTPAMRQAFAQAREKMQNSMTRLGVTDAELTQLAKEAGIEGGDNVPKAGVANGLRLEFWDYVKRGLDDQIGAAQRAGKNDDARILTGLKQKLVSELDSLDVTAAAGPNSTKASGGSYKQARSTYSGESEGVNRIENSIVGRLAELNDQNISSAAGKLFGPQSGPMAIADARNVLEKTGPEAWQALKRSWLQDMFETASRVRATNYQGVGPNTAGQFSAIIENNKARLKAALTPDEFAKLSDLTDVLKSASSVKAIGSDTEYNRLITEGMRDSARPWIARIAGNINPAAALRNFDDWLTTRNMEKASGKLADIITSPSAMKELKQLKMLSPNDIRFRIAGGHLMGAFGAAEARDVLFAPEDRPAAAP